MNSHLLNNRGTSNAQHSTVAYGSGAYHLHNSGMREPNLYGPGAYNSGVYNMERFCPDEALRDGVYYGSDGAARGFDGHPYHHHHHHHKHHKHHHMHPGMQHHYRSGPDYGYGYSDSTATYPASMHPDGNPPMHSTMPAHPESTGFFGGIRSWFDRDILAENVPARGDAYSSDRHPSDRYRSERSHSPYAARTRRGDYTPYDSTGLYDGPDGALRGYAAHGGSHDSRNLHDECRLYNDAIRRDKWRMRHEETSQCGPPAYD